MAQQYPVTCLCGKTVLVGEAQAGSSMPCGCGAELAVPKLRELRKLAPVAESTAEAPAAAASSPWDARQSVLFVCGTVTVLALIVSGILLAGRSRLDISWSHENQKEVDDHLIDHLDPAQTIGAYYEMRAVGLGDQEPSSFMLNRETYDQLSGLMHWALGVAGLGALAWIGANFTMSKKSSKN